MHIHIIGGGIIGLFTAIHLQNLGHAVIIYNAPEIPAASNYAGGMLAPFSEAWIGRERALTWGKESLQLWENFFCTLSIEDRHNIVTAESSLMIGVDRADQAHIQRVAQWLQLHEYAMTSIKSAEISQYPGLSARLSGGIRIEAEYAVDNRKTLTILQKIFIEQGGQWIPEYWVSTQRGRGLYIFTQGMELAQEYDFLGIRGVQGEIIRLERPHWAIDIPQHTIRGILRNRNVYIIPRDNGIVIGATEYEESDRKAQVGGVFDLLADAITILPGIRDYTITEVAACVRPVRPDALPWVGRLDENTIIAGGHGRDGFLLAPLTAQAIGWIIDSPHLGRRDLLDHSLIEA